MTVEVYRYVAASGIPPYQFCAFNPAAALVIEVGETAGGSDDVSLTHFSAVAGDSVDMLQDPG